MGEAILSLLSAFGPLAVALALLVVGLLSQRLGAVTKMPRYYYGLFVAAALVGVSAVARLLAVPAADQESLGLLYAATFAAGVTLGVVVAWRYWSWLFSER